MPDISLVVPVWDNLVLTQNSVMMFLYCTHSDLEVIIVDNGSSDGTWAWCRQVMEDEPRFHAIHNKENRGYGPGLNQGLMAAKGEYLVCLNNDVVVYHTEWCEQLVAPLRANPRLICGARVISGNRWVEVDNWVPDYLEGYCLAFHRQFLTDVGFFDEHFAPAFVEDVEICWRAEQHGYQMELVPMVASGLHHLYGKTTYVRHAADTPHREITRRNAEYFRKKVREGNDAPFYPEGWVPEVS